jgi:hypothetical protein
MVASVASARAIPSGRVAATGSLGDGTDRSARSLGARPNPPNQANAKMAAAEARGTQYQSLDRPGFRARIVGVGGMVNA